MLCPLCNIYRGDPCTACRTLSRVSWALKIGKLLPSQEDQVVAALRVCSGALLDLIEVASREKGTPVPTEAHLRDRRKSEEPAKEKKRTSKEDKKAKKEEKEKKEKEEKRESKRKRVKKEASSPSADRSTPGVRTIPTGSARDKKAPAEPLEEVKEEEFESEESEEEEEDIEEELERERRRSRFPSQERVEADPRAFGLEGLPARPAENTRGETEDRGSRVEDRDRRHGERPREPSRPPPGDHHRGVRESRVPIERRQQPKRKKNKGKKHRERGIERSAHRRQEQWRRRWP